MNADCILDLCFAFRFADWNWADSRGPHRSPLHCPFPRDACHKGRKHLISMCVANGKPSVKYLTWGSSSSYSLPCLPQAATALLHFLTAQQGTTCVFGYAICVCVCVCSVVPQRLPLMTFAASVCVFFAVCFFCLVPCVTSLFWVAWWILSLPLACSPPYALKWFKVLLLTLPMSCLAGASIGATAAAAVLLMVSSSCLVVLIVCHGVKWFPSYDSLFPFLYPFSPRPLSPCYLLEIPFTCLCTWHSSSHLGGPPAFCSFSPYTYTVLTAQF